MTKWKTQQGIILDIADMSLDHVKNAKALLEKRVNEAEYALASVSPLDIGSFAYAQAEEYVKKAKKYIKIFDKRISLAVDNLSSK